MPSFFDYFVLLEELHNYGVGILPIAEETGRFLIAKRSLMVAHGNTWATWGGKAENGNVQSEAIREFKEETKYTGNIKLIPAYVYKEKFVYHNFIGIVPKEFTPSLNWENLAFNWINYNQLARLSDKHHGLTALLKNSRGLIMDTLNDIQKN